MLYFLFILILIAVIFAIVWLVTRGEKAATGEPDKFDEPDNTLE